MQYRICRTCNKRKQIIDFPFRRDSNSYRKQCKDCRIKHHREYNNRIEVKKRHKELYELYKKDTQWKSQRIKYIKEYLQKGDNKKKRSTYNKNYMKGYNPIYRINNKERILEKQKEYNQRPENKWAVI